MRIIWAISWRTNFIVSAWIKHWNTWQRVCESIYSFKAHSLWWGDMFMIHYLIGQCTIYVSAKLEWGLHTGAKPTCRYDANKWSIRLEINSSLEWTPLHIKEKHITWYIIKYIYFPTLMQQKVCNDFYPFWANGPKLQARASNVCVPCGICTLHYITHLPTHVVYLSFLRIIPYESTFCSADRWFSGVQICTYESAHGQAGFHFNTPYI